MNGSVTLFDKTPLTLTVKFPDYGVNEDVRWGHMTSSDRHSESAKGAQAEFSSSVERLFLSHGSEILDSVYNFSLTNHDQSARVLYTLPRTHKKVKMLTISSKPVFTKCKNVRKTKIEPYETCTTATFSLQISALLSPASGFFCGN